MSIKSILNELSLGFENVVKSLFDIASNLKTRTNIYLTSAREDKSLDAARSHTLIKNRPASLNQGLHYDLVNDDAQVDTWFFRLRDELFEVVERMRRIKGGPVAIKEFGWLEAGRPYFYIKPLNKEGMLFEKTSTGWMVTSAEKIVGESTFIRQAEAWDQVLLYTPKGHDIKVSPRVASERLAGDRMHFQIYEEKLLPYLGL